MSKLFICDKCGAQFESPLDEEYHTDKHGILHKYDLCAPCREDLKTKNEKVKKDFFEKAGK
jgi:hypothetical protein